MKKLFVLFLLVSLVPFTVGCSLWGGDDEAVTYPTTWTAKVTVPSTGLSLRAVTPVSGDTYFGYTITINGVELPITDVTVDGANNSVLTFAKVMDPTDTAEIAAMKATEVAGNSIPVTINKADGTVAETFVYVSITSTGAFSVNYTTGSPVLTIGTTGVVTADTAATIVSVKNDDVAVSATQDVVVANGNIVFTITGSQAFNAIANVPTYSIKVGGTAVTAENFTLTQAAEGTTATITIPAAGRVAGKAYTVAIEYIKVGTVLIGSTSYSFKMPNA